MHILVKQFICPFFPCTLFREPKAPEKGWFGRGDYPSPYGNPWVFFSLKAFRGSKNPEKGAWAIAPSSLGAIALRYLPRDIPSVYPECTSQSGKLIVSSLTPVASPEWGIAPFQPPGLRLRYIPNAHSSQVN